MHSIDHAIYKDKRVFITGHTGFKGSWLALWLVHLGAEVAGYSLPAEELSHFKLLDLKIKNYFANINDAEAIQNAMLEFKPDIVFHLAAQPLVRDSYDDPIKTYDTNVTGSLKVYLAALKANVPALVSITTDKVYENKERMLGYVESDQLGGYDPYSSSKACMEIMTDSFRRSYLSNNQILLATARAGNVIGGGDWAKDRLIPDFVRNASQNKPTPIRNPGSVRPWQHVLDPLNGYLLLGSKLLKGQKEFASAFNFGPELSGNLSVAEIGTIAKKTWDKIELQVDQSGSQKHEANLLVLDITKAKKILGWQPIWSVEKSIEMTVNWYKKYYLNNEYNSIETLKVFIENAKT